jgi:hypothetical protein
VRAGTLSCKDIWYHSAWLSVFFFSFGESMIALISCIFLNCTYPHLGAQWSAESEMEKVLALLFDKSIDGNAMFYWDIA